MIVQPCHNKKAFQTPQAAYRARQKFINFNGTYLDMFKCATCGSFHLGNGIGGIQSVREIRKQPRFRAAEVAA